MELNKAYRAVVATALVTTIMALSLAVAPTDTFASGGSTSGGGGSSGGSGGGGGGGGTTTTLDTIKVNKCYYADVGAYVELLLNAVSSNSSAHLYAYLPDGTYLGEVQNGGGGQYGGTVFVTLNIPASITFVSSAGAVVTVSTQQFQF